jgi:hypothetical protein
MSEISGKTNIHNIHFWNSELLSWYDDTKLKSSRNVSEFLKSLGKIHFCATDDTKWNVIGRVYSKHAGDSLRDAIIPCEN